MKQYKIDNVTVLESDEGKTLFNGETYSKMVMLGINDKVQNWKEISDSEVPQEEEDILDSEALQIIIGENV